MTLDPFMVKALNGITGSQIYDAWLRLYPEYQEYAKDKDHLIASMEKWLEKLRKKPGSALSTGRRNSSRGEMTCALLEVLRVERPKAERTRMDLAWEILNSELGRDNVGHVPELEIEREIAANRGFGVLR